ncbi:MAG TPA: adenosine deaminase [Candidatus Baltobacteraceae bacterium]
MPKAEIHVHLEGATTAATYFEIAKRNGVVLDVDSLPQWHELFKFTSFDHFIEVYVAATKCLRTPDDYALLIRRFAEQQAALNVRYTESFISCSLLANDLDRSAFLDVLLAGIRDAEDRLGIGLRFIADISREIPQSQDRVLPLAIEGFKRGALLGIGLGGPEHGFPPELFERTFRGAREAGLHVVAHAGETVGTPSIIGALDTLGAERIGHGVLSLDDPALLARLRESQVPLEICPQSNYRVGIVAPGQAHPIRGLRDAGVYCTVNSDDPAMFETDLNNEYATLASQGFTWEELWALNLATLDATFASDADKRALKEQWSEMRSGWGDS